MILILTTVFVLAVIGTADFITLLTPLLVYLATQLAKWVLPKVQGWMILSFIVPGLSMLIVYLSQLVSTDNVGFWMQVIYGLLAVLIDQLIKQFSATKQQPNGSGI